MKKWTCSVCGYVYEGEAAPAVCPICNASSEKFSAAAEGLTFADEHKVGVAQGLDEEVVKGLRANFNGECMEVGMYIAMSRQAHREGYPEIGEAFYRYALEEADHAARFAELLGEVLTDDTCKNVKMRAEAECGACAGKKALAVKAKELGYDAVHDTVHEMCKDEARHGKGFSGLLKRYFNA